MKVILNGEMPKVEECLEQLNKTEMAGMVVHRFSTKESSVLSKEGRICVAILNELSNHHTTNEHYPSRLGK